ncbi:Snp1p [Sugiyamaella lignohabitans]|uniref:Snp1p n=1 Tax=Sugiyamaella lignohabitans TaxID=796027 RepID=A0A167D5E7_9ASCO|nr:Snp1p [Sugiyamaella lignohabitans]ANB12505.1 Snp1p [Sugiyamaella lignohabitans]
MTTDHEKDYVPTDNWLQIVKNNRRKKAAENAVKLKEAIAKWNPDDDPQVRGDPYKTLFLSRLHYDIVEKDLEEVFSRYGILERIRLVRDQEGKSRGYAFIVFERERDMRIAHKENLGLTLKGRRVVVDVERGRTTKGWKPRKLGGGRGGRGYTKEELLRRRSALSRPLGDAPSNGRDRNRDSRGGRPDRGPDRGHDRGSYHDRDGPPPRNGSASWDKRAAEREYRDRERAAARNDFRGNDRYRDRDRPRDRDPARYYDRREPPPPPPHRDHRPYRERSPPRHY